MHRILSTLIILAFLTGCPEQKCEEKEQEPIKKVEVEDIKTKPLVELQSAEFDELPGWSKDNFAEAIPAFENNCMKIGNMKTQYIDKSEIKIPTSDYMTVCKKFYSSNISNSLEFKIFIEENFKPYLVLDNGDANGKFTSYYEAMINASFEKDDKYIYPIYGKPENLIEINLRDFDPSLPNKRLTGRIENQKFIPYYSRKDIENIDFDAPVLMWADSLVDIHIMQIQGSAVAVMSTGEKIRIGYADNNGHNFKGIGSILLSKGYIKPGQANMIAIKEWLKNNPELGAKKMQENSRFIFHRIIEGDGPIGAFGVALKEGRSMAVDRDIIPLGSILWLNTNAPDKSPIQKLVAAQDIGSAIKGVVRGDYFWGSGGDEILAAAGSMNSIGQYYILIPKKVSEQ